MPTASRATKKIPMGQLLKVTDVAQRCCVSPELIWKLVYSHELKAVRIGRAARISESELHRFLESRTT